MSERLGFEPYDPRDMRVPPGEQFRRRHRVFALLSQGVTKDRDRRKEIADEVLKLGVPALPALREVESGAHASGRLFIRSLQRQLVPDEVGRDLARMLDKAGGHMPLELGAAMLARLENPTLAIEDVITDLDALADRAAAYITGVKGTKAGQMNLATEPMQVLLKLCEFWRDEGFKGNTSDYSDPRNSWLPAVMERKTGIPISLSVLFVALARRLGLTAWGVGLPFHFIARVDMRSGEDSGYVFLDPFHGARPLDLDDCRRLVEQAGTGFEPNEHLEAAGTHDVLIRMCNNLITANDQNGDPMESERVATVLIHLSPGQPLPLLLRAERRLRRGAARLARTDLHKVLELNPDPTAMHAAMHLLKQVETDQPF